MDAKILAAVVVLYNPVQEEIDNIKSYLQYVSKVYVVDNSYNDDAKSLLPKSEKISYIPNYDNLGIAAALNIGIKKAIKEGYDWILTMDQDTNFIDNTFMQFLNSIPQDIMKNYGIITPWHKTRLHDPKPKEDIDYPTDVMTSGNLLNTSIYQKIGEFKEELFIDGVDIDYCFRLRINGYKIMRINTIELRHNLGDIKYVSFFGREVLCTNHNHVRRYYIARNYLYIKKWYNSIDYEYCTINARQRRWIIKILLFETDKLRKIKNIILGKIDYYRGITGRKF